MRKNVDSLLTLLQQRSAPILAMDTKGFGDMFKFGWHAYEKVGRYCLKGMSFVRELYTPQDTMPSLAHQDVLRKAARSPKGSGEVYDAIHGTLRSLGNRIAQVFLPAIRQVIGDEVDKVRREDRPPRPAAKGMLTKTKAFEGVLTDATGEHSLLPLQNVAVEHLQTTSSLLETALALREQAIAAFGRNYDTFRWIRDNIELQSTETLEQIQRVLRSAIARAHPGKTLVDFRLEVTGDERLAIAEKIFRRTHDLRRDYALMTIAEPSDRKRFRYGWGPERPLNAVGEREEGFHVASPLDAAAVVASMRRCGEILPYVFPEGERQSHTFPQRLSGKLRTLAEHIFKKHNLHEVRRSIRGAASLLERVAAWQEGQLPLPGVDSRLGMARALEILRDVE